MVSCVLPLLRQRPGKGTGENAALGESTVLICFHSTRLLLHYTARDEVALFDRGTGGVPEVRNAINKYEEMSPLYGFLQYRRRKVILRYMPEGLSRLIQGTTYKMPPRLNSPLIRVLLSQPEAMFNSSPFSTSLPRTTPCSP